MSLLNSGVKCRHYKRLILNVVIINADTKCCRVIIDDKLRGFLKKLVKLRQKELFHIFRSQFFKF